MFHAYSITCVYLGLKFLFPLVICFINCLFQFFKMIFFSPLYLILRILNSILLILMFLIFIPQGSVLSSFFWGYTMTQFLGGYLADRIGGDVILPIVAVFWSMITFWTPQLAHLSTDKYLTIQFIVLSRVFLGMFQGMMLNFVFCIVVNPHFSS